MRNDIKAILLLLCSPLSTYTTFYDTMMTYAPYVSSGLKILGGICIIKGYKTHKSRPLSHPHVEKLVNETREEIITPIENSERVDEKESSLNQVRKWITGSISRAILSNSKFDWYARASTITLASCLLDYYTKGKQSIWAPLITGLAAVEMYHTKRNTHSLKKILIVTPFLIATSIFAKEY